MVYLKYSIVCGQEEAGECQESHKFISCTYRILLPSVMLALLNGYLESVRLVAEMNRGK